MGIKLTNEEFKKRLIEKGYEDYTPLDKYKGLKVKIGFKHNICNENWEVTPDNLLNSNVQCPYCQGVRTSIFKIKEKVKKELGDEYEYVKGYVNDKTEMTVKHKTCNTEYEIKPNQLKHKTGRCPNCFDIKKVKRELLYTELEFKNEIEKITNGEYSVLEPYKGTSVKILFKHNVCKHTWKVRPDNFIGKGSRCPKCVDYGTSNTTNGVKQTVYDLVGDEYRVVGEYKNALTKIDMLHAVCNNVYPVRPCDFKDGNRCPYCKRSTGEEAIMKFLEENKITYKPEYKFEDCKDKNPLPFDFAVLEDEKIKCLIEFDGLQHFKPIEYFGGQETYEKQVLHDKIKEDYAKNNNIQLIRISEIEDIEKMLEFLKGCD